MGKLFTFEIKGHKFSIDLIRNRIESIMLYGSHALGNPNKKSDVDLFIIVDDCSNQEFTFIRNRILKSLKVPANWINLYTKRTFMNMCRMQDYFLWHIKLNGKFIYSRSSFTAETLDRLPIFTHVEAALYDDRNFIKRSYARYRNGSLTRGRMLSFLTGRIRNTCILICFLIGFVDFDKFSTLDKCLKHTHVKVPYTYHDYRKLYDLKQQEMYRSGSIKQNISPGYINWWYKIFLEYNSFAISYSKKVHSRGFKNPLYKYK